MQKFDKILVALDNSDIDEDLINAASVAADIAGSSKVSFIHIIKDINIPANVKKEFPNIVKDAVDERKKSLEQKIDQYFSNESAMIATEIASGIPTKSILKFSAKNDIDLIIMGRKNEQNGGIIVQRVARRAACSLLIVTKTFNRDIKKILIPFDFSSPSLEAFNHTIELAQNIPDIKIIAQNVYQVPTGYHSTGKSYSEFAKIMAENVKNDFENFSKKINNKGMNISPIYTLDRHEDVISTIYKTAKSQKADCIVISAKGRTSTTALFLGSKAEKMIQLDSEIPLVVIRPKGKLEGILDYLKKL